ncbi:MAG: hypothetical protein VYA55_01315 [Pseudomonadota bacterium]|nr:hypothetical protein [Pseudomonadota bacterium]
MKWLLRIDGQYWLLQDDGTLIKLSAAEVEALGSDVIHVSSAASPIGAVAQAATSAASPSTLLAHIHRVGPEQLPDSRFQTQQRPQTSAESSSQAGTDAKKIIPPLNADAEIAITIEDGGDEYINMFEVSAVDLFGPTLYLWDNQEIDILVTDSQGATLQFITQVNNDGFIFSGADLSGLAQGEINAQATARDFYGNRISAVDTAIIDTLAIINDDLTLNGGLLLNAVEALDVDFTGTTAEINPGQTLNLLLTDGNNLTQAATTTLAGDGSYQISAMDLSGLADGVIRATLTSMDIPGNIAVADFTFMKDSVAVITVQFDGTPPYSSAEIGAVTVSGTVTEIEPGRTIDVTITDGSNTTNATATVQANGTWQIDPLDLTGFNDGTLTVNASSSDVAGNPAAASNTAVKDTLAALDIDTVTGIPGVDGLDIDALRRGETVNVKGSTTEVEAGQAVTLRFSDALGNQQSFSALVQGDGTWSTDVTIADLGPFASWNLDASVSDVAGNEATDATPTLDVPTTVQLSEQALLLYPTGFSAPSTVTISGYDALVFSVTQVQLEALTAGNIPLAVTVSGDGQSLSASAGATPVLQAVINGDGTVTVTLLGPVDQGLLRDSAFTSIQLDATQNDADSTFETVTVALPVVIRDSGPFTTDDRYTAVEQVATSGNVFDNDILQEGPLRLLRVEVEGSNYTIAQTGPTTITTAKGELKVYADGRWNFVAARNLDNTVLQTLDFRYDAVDQDGDFDSSDVVITITDGAAGVFPSGSRSGTEQDYGDTTTYVIDFVVGAGTDDLIPASLVFTPNQVSTLTALGYTSDGTPLTYSLSGGNTLVASAGASVVFEIALTAVNDSNGNLNATATTTQYLPLDHGPTDSLLFPVEAQATDLDGTVIAAGSTLELLDGNQPVSSATDATLNENDLTTIAQDTGTVQVTLGSDAIADLGFTSDRQPTLTSGGVAVQYQVSPDGLTLTAFTTDALDPVFTVVIASEPDATSDSAPVYTFTLFKALDQLNANGSSDPLNFNLRYQVTDADGDSIFASIPVSVSDASAASGSDIAVQLSETPKATGNADTPSSTSLDFVITASQDPIVQATFDLVNGKAVQDSNGNTLSQNGNPLSWQQLDNVTWQARTDAGTAVLQVALPASVNVDAGAAGNIPLTVSVLSQIDHLDAGTPVDNLTVPVNVIFTDSDGTTTPLQADISIFDGRNPVATSAGTLTVDEAGTLSGPVSDNGLAFGSRGSDSLVTTQVSLNTALTSGGVAVTLAGSADASGWWVASAGGNEVFRVKAGLDGLTEFQLSAPLDHAPANGENNLAIDFGLSLRDADGDTSNVITMTVNVTDDVPAAADINVTGTEGGSRTINVLANDKGGADGAILTRVNYDGVDYTFTSDPETITLMEGGQQWGTATVYSDGRITVVTNTSLNANFFDSLDFEVTDSDDDVVVNTLNMNVQDEAANIDISPLVTTEDTPLTLTLTANPGDLDNNEQITAITFSLAELQGGTLTLNGVALPADGSGNPQLTGAGLLLVNPATGEVQPNGTLVYTPAQNISDPTHDVRFDVTVTVNTDSGTRTHDDSFDVSVTPVVDPPQWDGGSGFAYDMLEDGAAPSFNLQANLFDTDGSESLSYRIDNIESGLTLRTGNRTLSNGATLSSAELAALQASTTPNLAGQLQFDLFAISRENSTGATAEISQTITMDVAPVADTPTLSATSIFMLEDELVALNTFMSGALTDNDGSETLSYQLSLPRGWMISDALGNETGLVSPGVYRVSDADVQNGVVFLKPLDDISSVSSSFSMQIQSIATESSVDGIDPAVPEALSAPRTINIDVQSVVDEPAVGPGPDNAWSFDGTTISGSFAEDSLIPLNFSTGTEDDDGSEIFDFVLRDLPAGVQLVDANRDLAQLNVTGTFNGKPVYALTATELSNLFVKTATDFSGQVQFGLIQTNTEPDGDSGSFNLVVDITVTPVVDTANGLGVDTVGAEDTAIVLQFSPPLADIDGSETLTNIIITSVPNGAILLLDGAPVTVPGAGLDLAQLATDNGTDFTTLINSARLQVQPPEDSDQDFSIPVQFEITDTSGLGQQAVQLVSGNLNVDVRGIVDDNGADGITRIETIPTAIISTDGSAVSLANVAQFVEADIDGSEYLDYISISVPQSDGWFITHPNGAIHDGQGNWLIPATGLTSDSVVETAAQLLAGATILSDHVGSFEIVVAARVLDHGDDADIISNALTVEFQAANTGSAQAVATLQTSIIDGLEAATIDTSGHLNTNAAGDGNDVVSYRVDAADMLYGGAITGADVITQYAGDGTTVVAWVFTNASLPSLAIVNMDEDFAGAVSIPVNKIATDPQGATVVSVENLAIELQPVVDAVADIANIQIVEDTATPLNINLNALLGDQDADPAQGVETVVSVRFLEPSPGFILDPSNLLTDNGDGSFTLNDPSRLNEIYYRPPVNLSGEGAATLQLELNVQDQTTGITLGNLNDTVTATISKTVSFDVIADTDITGDIFGRNDQEGDEDSDILLEGLTVLDFDSDGSETLSLQLLGVPQGAVLYWNNGGTLVQLINNGADGSGGNAWSFSPDQLDNLVLRPPRDFSGEFVLTLQTTSMELSTQEVVINSRDFLVEVYPVADGAEFYSTPQDVNGQEGSIITIGVYARTTEAVNPDEVVVVNVVVKDTSDTTALQGVAGIRTPDGRVGLFQNTGSGFVASVTTTLTQLASLELFAGANAFGTLDIDIQVGSRDSAVLGGNTEYATTAPADMATQSISIDIAPLPDAPLLTLDYDYITAATGTVPLNLNLTLQNPAPGETSDLVISGLPDGVNLNAGSRSGTDWIVNAADVDGLNITNPQAGASYQLSFEPRSTLNGTTVSGGVQAITIDMAASLSGDNTFSASAGETSLLIGGDGNDTLNANTGEDTFLFRMADLGSSGTPALDQITAFDVSQDHLNLSDIAAGMSTGIQLDTIIDLSESAGSTTLAIDLGSGVVQNIELQNVTRDDLYGGSGWSNDADILQRMLQEQILITG